MTKKTDTRNYTEANRMSPSAFAIAYRRELEIARETAATRRDDERPSRSADQATTEGADANCLPYPALDTT